ncbi:hypothetical protein [Pelagibius sp.]|uniref:hypothetical protein n=1 Tax=Pelagibius sp. TaxID=1931238 RepID=UPI003BB1BC96
MSHFAEKEEECPRCGEVKRWLYDAQICAACNYGNKASPSQEAAYTFEDWIAELNLDVIQDGYGYGPGEFTVFPEQWFPLFEEGLSPLQAFQRALRAHRDENRPA